MLRSEEALEVWTESRLTQEEAARLLGGCARTFPLRGPLRGVGDRRLSGHTGVGGVGAASAGGGRHDVKRRVRVYDADGTLSVFHGPRRLARYDAGGAALTAMMPVGDDRRGTSGRH